MDPTRRQAADRQIIAILVSLSVAFVLHLAGIASTLLNLVQEATDPRGIFTLASGTLTDEEMGERVGRAVAFFVCGAYSGLGLLWIPINAFGVYSRKRWGRASTLAYFATTIVTCCCTPIGAYGIYALMRADVKELFDERRT